MTLNTLSKQEVRRQTLAQRKQLSSTEHKQLSQHITEQIYHHPHYQHAKCILAYLNFGHEYASEQFVTRVLQDQKKLVLPRVNPSTRELDLYVVDDLASQLETGSYGIREPNIQHCSTLKSLNEVELVLLPGVAFTRRGERLGYGGGFYDKLLARFPHSPSLMAAAFSLQIVDYLPQEPTDIKVEWIITEHEVIHCSA